MSRSCGRIANWDAKVRDRSMDSIITAARSAMTMLAGVTTQVAARHW
jgi:hypothetical protein